MIDNASMDILENVGVQFRDPIALEDWRKAGAKVVGEMVYLDRGLVRDLIATIPSDFTYHARNPENNVRLGGSPSTPAPGGSPTSSRGPPGCPASHGVTATAWPSTTTSTTTPPGTSRRTRRTGSRRTWAGAPAWASSP